MDMEELSYFIFMEGQEKKSETREWKTGGVMPPVCLYSSKRSISDGSKSSSNVASFSQNS